MKKLPTGIKLIILLISTFLLVVTAMLFFVKGATAEEGMFGPLKVKAGEEVTKNNLSKYEIIKQEKEEKEKKSVNKLRYKVRIRKENPFLSLYQEEKSSHPIEKKPFQPVKAKSRRSPKKPSQGFFSVKNDHLTKGEKFFKAIFRERQAVRPGKALRIILEEPIPELDLKAGTVLKGIPDFMDGRIMIRITAGIVDGEVKRVSLSCYDREDFLEGIYHDHIDYQLEEDIKDATVDELLDIDFKGNDLAKKATAIAREYKDIYIEKGKELLVAIPHKEVLND